jgi:hypothetical protein
MSRHLHTILIVFLLLGTLAFHSAQAQSKQNCDEIKVKAVVTNTSAGESNGKIHLEFEEANVADTYKVILFGSGWEKPLIGDKEGFENLSAGFYDVYLIDKKGCSKQLNVQVK